MTRALVRGGILTAVIVGFSLWLGYQPVLLAVCLLIAAAAMLWKSWVLASRAEVTR